MVNYIFKIKNIKILKPLFKIYRKYILQFPGPPILNNRNNRIMSAI